MYISGGIQLINSQQICHWGHGLILENVTFIDINDKYIGLFHMLNCALVLLTCTRYLGVSAGKCKCRYLIAEVRKKTDKQVLNIKEIC